MGQQIILPPYILSIHGRLSKKSDLVYYSRYGKTFSKILLYCNPPATAAQKVCRNIFKEANDLAWADVRDKNKKLYWGTIAAQSNGKYKSARGAAIAHHYAEIEKQIKEEQKTTEINIEALASIAHPSSGNYKPLSNRQHNRPLLQSKLRLRDRHECAKSLESFPQAKLAETKDKNLQGDLSKIDSLRQKSRKRLINNNYE